MIQSNKDSLNWNDLRKWGKNSFLFSIPALLAYLTALQSGGSMSFAAGAAYSAILASSIDLLRKYSAGAETGSDVVK